MIKKVFEKYSELMTHEDSIPLRIDQRIILSSNLNAFLNKHYQSITDDILENTVPAVSNIVRNFYGADGDWVRRNYYIKNAILLSRIEGNPSLVDLESIMREYAGNVSYEAYSQMDKEYIEALVNKYPGEFRALASRELRIYKLGRIYLPQSEYIDMVTNLLDKLRDVDSGEKDGYADAIYALKCANDLTLVNRFAYELLQIKATNPNLVKKYRNKHMLFNSDQKAMLKV